MGEVTRFPDGMNTQEPTSIFRSLPMIAPAKMHTYFNDFDQFIAADWVVTETQAGATQALTAGDGGLLLLTNSAADDDLNSIQKTPASFTLTPGKETFFSCRFKVSDALQSDLQIGLVIVDTTPFDATDGVYFQKDDGDAQLDFIVRKDATTGSTSVTNIATVVSDTFMTIAWAYDGVSRIRYSVDGVVLGSLDASAAYLPDATNLTVSISLQNGEAVAKNMTIDWVYAAKSR